MARHDAFEVSESFRFIGRTFAEYRRLFGLERDALAGAAVLDCPGGPSSFTAVAARVADRTVAVDPVYGTPLADLAPVCRDAVERTVEQLRASPEQFVWTAYSDPADRGRYLRAAAERFLADYTRRPGRYLRAALPALPLATDSVDLALCGHLLFLYDDRLDAAFHADALCELARVARREVRVFPLHALDGDPSALVGPTSERLRDRGLAVERRPVDYEFQPGATEMLVVSDVAGFAGA
ncbi:class I SAM-dependent methyltransferase [Haloarcula onubensis]|uniref:Class I SAM-dependent methyltransferase n=1 Tax=Haloarcula onubensis TaxID=2950539 RepID=A0ABU2FLG0_9EURY|nr:class I SAM-dependent methyltransferase [Halomicroarcula sp. S3CR25-11]MDS0281031.1 class I SAM-dependent methyltransferase [Halomicroarcula sp. S3CR25-11]